MRNTSKPVMVLVMFMLVATCVLGIVYGAWPGAQTTTVSNISTGSWSNGQFSTASYSNSGYGTGGVDSYPSSNTWPSYKIRITGGGITSSGHDYGPALISYTVKNTGTVPIKMKQVTVTISTSFSNLEVTDTTSTDPLYTFDYTNLTGGTSNSGYTSVIIPGGTATGTIVISAKKSSGINGKSFTVDVSFTCKPFTE